MKKQILILLFSFFGLSGPTLAADVLLKYEFNGGLFTNFENRQVSLDSDGKVQLLIRKIGQPDAPVDIAQLSPLALENVKKQIQALDVTVTLVDANPTIPVMTDAPTAAMTVTRDGQSTLFYEVRQGHKYTLQFGEGAQLIEIMQGLFDLAK
jgi:hypothetical protein